MMKKPVFTPTLAALIALIALIAAGCCGKHKQEVASLKDANAALQKEKDGLDEKLKAVLSYNKALEEELVNLGFDKEDLAKKHKAAQESIKAISESLGAAEKKLASAKTELESVLADLSANKKLVEEMKQKQAQAQKRVETLKGMLAKFKSLIEAGKLKVKIRKGKMVIEMPSAILFTSGKASLSEDGELTLTMVAEVLASIKDREFQVAGHTDNAPKKKMKFKDNWELSAARALTVVRFLQENAVSAASLSASGYSEFQPVAANDTEESMAQNRRIEVTIMPNLSELPDVSDLEKMLK